MTTAYPNIRPLADLLDSLTDLFELLCRLFGRALHPFSYSCCLMLGPQLRDLGRQACDISGKCEEVVRDLASEVTELWVIGVLGVVLTPPVGRLALESGAALERHGGLQRR